jgi:hypothetical protein
MVSGSLKHEMQNAIEPIHTPSYMHDFFQKRKFKKYYLFLFLALICTVQVMLFGSKFGTNDNVGMSQIANGGFTGRPSEHLIFVNSLVGVFLKWLYSITQNVQWYSVLMIVSLISAVTVFLKSLRPKLGLLSYRDIVCLSFLIIYPSMSERVFSINYSSTAYFCTSLGFSSLIISLTYQKKFLVLGPIAICVLGFLWREPAFLSVCPIWLILLAMQYRRKDIRRFSWNIAVFVGLLATCKISDFLVRDSTPQWIRFYKLNNLRGKVHGNVVFEKLVNDYGIEFFSKSLAIPRINLEFFFAWFFSYSVMGDQQLGKLINLINSNSVFSDFEIGTIAKAETLKILLFLAAVLLFLIRFNYRYWFRYITLFCFLAFFHLISISYIEQFIRTPKYVTDGIQLNVIIAGLTVFICEIYARYTSNSEAALPKHYLKPIFFALLLAFIQNMSSLPEQFRVAKVAQVEFERNARSFERILLDSRNSFDQPFVAFESPIELADLSPWSNFRMTSIPSIPLGWTMSSPLEKSRLSFFGVSDDMDQAFLTGKLSILSATGSTTPFQVQRYLMTNFDECLNVQSNVLVGTNFMLTRFTKSTDCENGVFASSPLTGEVFLTHPDFSVFLTNCANLSQNRTIELDLHSPFGQFAKPFSIEVDYIGRNFASTKLLYTIKPGGVNILKIETSGCEIDIRSISSGVVPKLLDKKSTDARTLYFGVSKVAITSK